ncbi:uncharacterized protein LOC106660345 [Trichogramma pretiosum]|uniref:uncharacterized protein LOC106660345 n=1 Tax=Trichogramma pretiosum TaxID=7493 RepID=UPI000C71C593|nr:uncharacterized protein LOC106660345 [Trichogramma pretiosum]
MDHDIYYDDDSLNDTICKRRRPLPEDEEDDNFFDFLVESDDENPEDMDYYGQINLVKLKSLRERLNWENEEERYPFYLRLSNLLRDWKGDLPNLKDIFRKEEIEWFLKEALIDRKKTVQNKRGQFFICFVDSTGYRDEPDLDKDGKPILHRSTSVHLAAKQNSLGYTVLLSKIYENSDVNHIDESGFTYFHALCKINRCEKVEKYLELGQDPNCLVTETGDSSLHLALYPGLWAKEMMGLLLKRGANPNLANKEGLTPLHMICKSWNFRTSGDVANTFFETTDANHQTIQIDAKDKLGRTPLQLAVANLRPDLVDVLLDRGADLASFAFPTENYFAKEWKPDDDVKSPNCEEYDTEYMVQPLGKVNSK